MFEDENEEFLTFAEATRRVPKRPRSSAEPWHHRAVAVAARAGQPLSMGHRQVAERHLVATLYRSIRVADTLRNARDELKRAVADRTRTDA
jgi:hypothetical protein